MRDLMRQTHSVLALIITLALIGAAVMLTFRAVPDSSRDLVAVVIGALAGGFGQLMKHYFDGSKSQQIRDAADAQRPPVDDPPPPA